MYQHQVCIGLNPARIVIGNDDLLPINARSDTKFLLGTVHHCKTVMNVLRKEKLYLSKAKIWFIASELKLLGWIIDTNGIQMDVDKVDSLESTY